MDIFSYLASYIPIRQELKFRIEGDIGITFNKQNFTLEYLNGTALDIFQMIDGKKTVSEIANKFMETTDVEKSVFEQDLIELLRDFQWKKLILLRKTV